jgi:hypothetical protein
MRRLLGLTGLIALGVLAAPEGASAQFTIDDFPTSVVPGRSAGTIPGYSGFGYGGYGTKGYGYWTGLALPPWDGGPSGAYSPIFSSLVAAPQENRRDLKRYDLFGAPHAGPPPGAVIPPQPGQAVPQVHAPPHAHAHAHAAPHRSLRSRVFFWKK